MTSHALAPDRGRRPLLPIPLLSAVSDRRRLRAAAAEEIEALVAWASAVAHAGVDLLQVREPDLEGGALARTVRRVLAATRGSATRVLVNERVDVALATGAAGVHLPAAAPSAARIRQIVPDPFVIGRSVHTVEEAERVEREGGCDYLTFGTVFPSASKPPGHVASGVEMLQRVTACVTLPVLAIGGITLDRVGDVADAGAAGVAAIGLFTGPADGDGSGEAQLGELVRALRNGWVARRG